ncbi:MAG: hypothetical protein PHS01_11925 [Dysgonamonadaceae bacterium]|nr:hypothetical protein [Dysgonamonadaceae bacterium]
MRPVHHSIRKPRAVQSVVDRTTGLGYQVSDKHYNFMVEAFDSDLP